MSSSSHSQLGQLRHPSDLYGQYISKKSAAGRLLSEQIEFSHLFLGDQEDASKYDPEAINERCRSGAEDRDVPRCRSLVTTRD